MQYVYIHMPTFHCIKLCGLWISWPSPELFNLWFSCVLWILVIPLGFVGLWSINDLTISYNFCFLRPIVRLKLSNSLAVKKPFRRNGSLDNWRSIESLLHPFVLDLSGGMRTWFFPSNTSDLWMSQPVWIHEIFDDLPWNWDLEGVLMFQVLQYTTAFWSTLLTSHMITLLTNIYIHDLWPSQGDAYESLPLHLEPLPAETEPPPPPGWVGRGGGAPAAPSQSEGRGTTGAVKTHDASGLRAFITTSGVVSKDGKFNTTVTWWRLCLIKKQKF